jgi:hypothetical protein
LAGILLERGDAFPLMVDSGSQIAEGKAIKGQMLATGMPDDGSVNPNQ